MVLILSNCTLAMVAMVAKHATHPMAKTIASAAYLSSEQVRRPALPPGKRRSGLTTSRGVAQRPEQRELTYGRRKPYPRPICPQAPTQAAPFLVGKPS